MADVKQEIQAAIGKIQTAFYKVANGRQSTVVAAIVARRGGAVPSSRFLTQFTNARASLLAATYALDEQLDQLRTSDPAAWTKILGAFNKASQSIPGVNISSTSVTEIIDLAIPPISPALFVPTASAAAENAVRTEIARYEARPGSGLGGLPGQKGGQLGFFQPLIGAVTGQACLAAAAVAGVATAGIGAAVVGAGCLLLAIGVIVATTVVAIYLVKRLPTSAATALAAADSLEDATEQVTRTCKENNLSTADCAVLQKKALDNTNPPDSLLDIPWTAVVAGVGALALWFFWPTIMGKARAARAAQSVSGLRSRRRLSRRARRA